MIPNPRGRYHSKIQSKQSMFKHATSNNPSACDCQYCACPNIQTCLKEIHTCCVSKTPSLSESGMTLYHR